MDATLDPHGWIDITYSVSDLTRALKELFGQVIGLVRVEGEVSAFMAHRSGHWYFTIRDPAAVLNCVMFRGINQMVRFQPRVGDKVVVTGVLDVYPPQGKVNFVVRAMERQGAGDLAAGLDALKRKLASEGLFDPARKRPLPEMPRAIGVATSTSGAALHDILKVLDRRFPGLTVYVAGCKVQGDAAPDEIRCAIELLNAHGGSDVIIVGRGGGSQEDLAAFNDEGVARAIARSRIPVVSAVGHEVDVSIADLVADVRAATPSHAAELVVPERDGLLLLLDDLDERLRSAMMRGIRERRRRLERIQVRHPQRRIADDRRRLQDLSERLPVGVKAALMRHRARLEMRAVQLDALSPDRVLERGYAVVLHEGRAVVDAASLSPGDRLGLRFHRGRAAARVERVEEP